MPGASRLGDKSYCPSDGHGCPGCAHPVQGPAVAGSPNVLINNKPALRVGDPGVHSACCGPNTWTATQGAATVVINGMPAMRLGDMCTHCGGVGKMIEASANVFIGDSPGSTSPGPAVKMIAAAGRSLAERNAEVNGDPSSYQDSAASNSAGGSSSATSSSSSSSSSANKQQSAFGNQNADHLAPKKDLQPKISGLKWSKPNATIGQTVDVIFKFTGFKAGDTANLKINRVDGQGNKTLLETSTINISSTDGTITEAWVRTKKEVQGDLQEGKSSGDKSPLSYRFEVEAAGQTQESGSLSFTQTINIKPQDKEGNQLPDGIDVVLTAADGKKHKGTVSGGVVSFENVTVGPMSMSVGA